MSPKLRTALAAIPTAAIGASAFVAVWSGWVGLGEMAGFGLIHPLPGIADAFTINTAITLPLGVEAYAFYAMASWLEDTAGTSSKTRAFAKWSSTGALALGMLGQVAYHMLESKGLTTAPDVIVVLVSCLPVLVLGLTGALIHLKKRDRAHAGDKVTDTAVDRDTVMDKPLSAPVSPDSVPAPILSVDRGQGQPVDSVRVDKDRTVSVDSVRGQGQDSVRANNSPRDKDRTVSPDSVPGQGQPAVDKDRTVSTDKPMSPAAVKAVNLSKTRVALRTTPDLAPKELAEILGVVPRSARRYLEEVKAETAAVPTDMDKELSKVLSGDTDNADTDSTP